MRAKSWRQLRLPPNSGFARIRGSHQKGFELPKQATEVISARVPAATAEKLRNVAARFGVPVSDVVTAAVDRYVLHDVEDDEERAA